MPYTSYKKTKNSKNSKSGGRRRKHTMRKYRRGRKVMRGGELIYPNGPTQAFLDWWGNEQGKKNWFDFLNWHVGMIRENKRTNKGGNWTNTMFESWLKELPTRVVKELYKAFNVNDDDRWSGGGPRALYDEMASKLANPTLVMRAVANHIKGNDKLKEMILRLHDLTFMY